MTMASGLRSSCAMPAASWPMAAIFSDWISWPSRRFRSETSTYMS